MDQMLLPDGKVWEAHASSRAVCSAIRQAVLGTQERVDMWQFMQPHAGMPVMKG